MCVCMCVCVLALGTTSVTSLRNVRCMHPQTGVQCHVGEGAAKMNSHPKGERLAEAVNIPKAHPNVGEAQLPRPVSGARQRKYLRGRSIRAVSRYSPVEGGRRIARRRCATRRAAAKFSIGILCGQRDCCSRVALGASQTQPGEVALSKTCRHSPVRWHYQ